MKKTKVTIIILHYQGKKLTRNCLQSIDKLNQKGLSLAGVTSVEQRGQALRAAIILWKQLDNGNELDHNGDEI